VILTARQLGVLRELAWRKDRPTHCRFTHNGKPWCSPMDFGGTNGSHHSETAKALAMKGLVDRYNYHTGRLNHFTGKAKGACMYRISDAGIKYIEGVK